MIKIGTPFITTKNERAELHAPVTITGDTAKRYVEVTDEIPNIVFLTKSDYPPAHWKEDGTVWFQLGDHGRNCGDCYACWRTMIPLDIMGKLDGFAERFELDKYHADRKKVFADLIGFSKIPSESSARDCVRQFAGLAEEEQSEAGKEFLEILSNIDDIPVYME